MRAIADCELLSLERSDFDRRVGKSLAAIQEIGRISSRRRREIKERGTDAALPQKLRAALASRGAEAGDRLDSRG